MFLRQISVYLASNLISSLLYGLLQYKTGQYAD